MNSRFQMAIVIAVVLIPSMFFYAIENPASTIAYVFLLEPSYVKKRVGYPLLDFRSYSSVSQITDTLQAEGYEVSAFSKNLSEGKSAPPYRRDTIEVGNYQNLNCYGNLILVFFNNRLAQVVFSPNNSTIFKGLLEKKSGRTIKDLDRIPLRGYSVLVTEPDGRGEISFTWEDRRLMAEHQAWMMRHS